jgi:Tfp pilus assembly protein PilE
MSTADELEKLHRLHTSGAMTSQEFAAQKAKLLGDPAQHAARGRMSALAIVAFALSFLLGPIGSLLGVVAVVVVATSKGRLRGIGFGIAAICVGVFFWGILAALAIPSFLSYVKKAKSTEARMNVERIFDGAVAYYGANGRLPPGADWTPAASCCDQNAETRKCDAAANAGVWATPAWTALGFAVADGFYYQYRLTVEGGSFSAEARGDLDCDGKASLFALTGAIAADGSIQRSAEVSESDPLE